MADAADMLEPNLPQTSVYMRSLHLDQRPTKLIRWRKQFLHCLCAATAAAESQWDQVELCSHVLMWFDGRGHR